MWSGDGGPSGNSPSLFIFGGSPPFEVVGGLPTILNDLWRYE